MHPRAGQHDLGQQTVLLSIGHRQLSGVFGDVVQKTDRQRFARHALMAGQTGALSTDVQLFCARQRPRETKVMPHGCIVRSLEETLATR
ncbi:MAG: hypothetical protein CMJ58_27425 [Planctomycetaceae bacterium]|nr:hypothetical protein [Planctomycetaceae bacterium]